MKKIVNNIYVQYLFIFVFATVIILSPYMLGGKSLISKYDALQQHIVAIKNIRLILEKILEGRFHFTDFWSWNIGIGADQFQIYSYYGMGDIFTYLGLLFKDYDVSFAVIMISKLFVSGLGMILFLDWKKKYSNVSILSGTMIYTYCGYSIHSLTSHPMFLTPMVILPFFLLSIDFLFERKNSVLISIVLAWALCSNFYFAFFVILAGAVYFFLEIFTRIEGYKNRWLMIFNVIIKLSIGVGISAVFFIPTVYAFLHSTRADVPFANGLKSYPLKFYVNFFNTFLMPPANRSFEFHGGYALIAIPALIYSFVNFKKNKNTSIGIILIFLGFISPIVAALINGASTPSLRWEFLLGIPLAVATANLIENITSITKKQYLLMLLLTFLSVLLSNFGKGITREIDPYLSFLLIWFIGIFVILLPTENSSITQKRKIFLLVIICVNAVFNGLYYNAEFGSNYVSSHIDRDKVDEYYDDYIYGLQSDIAKWNESNGFSRFSFTRRFHNTNLGSAYENRSNVGAWNNLRMVNSYFSLQNEYIGEFSNYYGNSDMVMTEPLRNVDNRMILSNYLGIEYLISRNKDDVPIGYDLIKEGSFKNQKFYIFKSQYSLPLMFGYNSVTSTENKLNGIIREDFLSTSAAINPEMNLDVLKKFRTTKNPDNLQEIPINIEKFQNNITISPKTKEENLNGNYEYYLKLDGVSVRYDHFLDRLKKYTTQSDDNKESIKDFFINESKFTTTGSTIQVLQNSKLLNLKYMYSPYDPSSFAIVNNILFNIGNQNQFGLDNGNIVLKLFSNDKIDISKIKLYKKDVNQEIFDNLL